jgi:hypothetical protein
VICHFDRLVDCVQTNCNIADARHAGDLTLCTYLLEMREFYRWEHDVAFSEQPPRNAVGEWLSSREALWSSLENANFQALPVDGCEYDPFDAVTVNTILAPHGLVYGAGIGRFGRPQFFLGQLKHEEQRDGARIFVAGCEYARDLGAAPAALLDSTIYLRQDSFKRWLWEKVEMWGVKKPDGALKETLDAYGFHQDPHRALERMTDTESETLILHELGEFEASKLLGAQWEEMCAALTNRRVELFVRAVRDNFADCLITLPGLMARRAHASVHFWFSNFTGMRRELFPHLNHAYFAWHEGDKHALDVAVEAGCRHWKNVCERTLALHVEGGMNGEAGIENLGGNPDIPL